MIASVTPSNHRLLIHFFVLYTCLFHPFFSLSILRISALKLTEHALGVVHTIEKLPDGYCLLARPRTTNPDMVSFLGVPILSCN